LKPYYETELGKLYYGDCLEIMPMLEPVDLVLTDPPYGINYNPHWLNERNIKAGKAPIKVDRLIVGDDGSLDLSFLFDYSRRLIWGFPYIYDSLASGWLAWDKQPGIETMRLLVTPMEMASTTLWQGFKLIRCMWGGYYRDNGEKRYDHPTQKPQKVISWVIADYTKPSDIILDPFLGSGTTAYCAKKLNRHCIGIEIEEKYCEIAAKRCSQGVFNFQ